jgi:hypothetical protein
MRVFATRWFVRFASSERIRDDRLCEAIERARRGLIDADLGRGLIKQRVARPGQGRRGGYRVLVACRTNVRAVFLYGFAKSERDNINTADLPSWQARPQEVLSANDVQIDKLVAEGGMAEIDCDEETETYPHAGGPAGDDT